MHEAACRTAVSCEGEIYRNCSSYPAAGYGPSIAADLICPLLQCFRILVGRITLRVRLLLKGNRSRFCGLVGAFLSLIS